MGGGVHIDFNLDFLSADPTSVSAKRTLFGNSRAALPGAMPTWYGRFRQYSTYEVGHIVFYLEGDSDLLPVDQRPNLSASNIYICTTSSNAGSFPPNESSAWQSLAQLSENYHTGFKSINRNDFLQGDNFIEDNQICLNLFEFTSTSYIICNSTLSPNKPGYPPIALKPRTGASFGGGVTRTLRDVDTESRAIDRVTVDYPDYAISGDNQVPLPSRKFGYAANSLNAQLGSEIESLDPKNDPLDVDIKRISYNLSQVYEVGDVVNYYPIASGSSSAQENFVTTNHPKIAVCVKSITSPAKDKNTGTVNDAKVPWNSTSTYWEDYTAASNRPNSSLSSIYDYLVNKKNKFPRLAINTSSIYSNLADQPVQRNKARISMNDFGGTSNIYGHFMVKWADPLKVYREDKCNSWYSGASRQSGPYQNGQYDIFIYTKNLRKDHGGQPRLAVTFGKTTAIKFLTVAGVSTFSTGMIDSSKINQYLKTSNFSTNNISQVNAESDIIHYQYNNLVPSYFMRRGYVHSRRRGGVHPGSNKGDVNLGKYILFIEDLLSRQRIEMVTPQIFSNGNPLSGLHGTSPPFQDWGEVIGPTRYYEYNSPSNSNLTELLSTKTTNSSNSQPCHYLILGNALSASDQIANKGISFTNNFVDRAFRPIILRTDSLSDERFYHILGIMQTGFAGVDASQFKNLTTSDQNIDNIESITNRIWMDLGETFVEGDSNPLFKSMSSNIGAFKENTVTNLSNLEAWNSTQDFKPQQITKINHSDYWEQISSSSNAEAWYHDINYSSNTEVYLWADGQKRYYKAAQNSIGLNPKESITFFRAIYAHSDKNPVFHSSGSDRRWTRVSIIKNNIGFLKGFVATINPYTSFRVLSNSSSWPTSGRKAVRIGFGWKRTFSEEGILNQISENNQESMIEPWSVGGQYTKGQVVSVQSGPIMALGPDGNYYTYEQWVRTFDDNDISAEEVSLIFAEAEAANPLFAFKCLKDTADADLNLNTSYAGIIPGYIPSGLGSIYYKFLSNLTVPARFDSIISENIISQTIWIELSSSQWQAGQIDSDDYERYGLESRSIRKRDIFGSGTFKYDLAYERYYQIGDAVVMSEGGVDVFKLKIKAFHLVSEVPSDHTEAGIINNSTQIAVKDDKKCYEYNIDLSLSSLSNYNTESSSHALIRSQWWQPIAQRTGHLNKNYATTAEPAFYYVVPASFDYIHLEDGLASQAKSLAFSSIIKVYADDVKTYDTRGSNYHWTSDVKNVSSSMINALPNSGSEADLSDYLLATIEHPYINHDNFGALWQNTSYGSGHSPHPLTEEDTDAHEAVKYFKTWLNSNFDVDLARDFNDGSDVNLDTVLSDKFDLRKYYEFYSPTVEARYQIYDSAGNAVGVEQDYNEGDEILINKGQRIKIIPSLVKDNGSSINSFSFMFNSFARNNVLGLYLRTPAKNLMKQVNFNYTFSSSAITEPPIDRDGLRIPFYTTEELRAGLPPSILELGDSYKGEWSPDEHGYEANDVVSFEGDLYEYGLLAQYYSPNEDVEPNMGHPSRWLHKSFVNPVTNSTTERAPEGTIFYQTGQGFKSSPEDPDDYNYGLTYNAEFSASTFITDTNLPKLLFTSDLHVSGNDQSDLFDSIDQSYEEQSIKDTLLSRFWKGASGSTLWDQYGSSGSVENNLLSTSPRWRSINGPVGQLTENEILDIDWSSVEVYATGDIVDHLGKLYIAEEINSGINPASESSSWSMVQPYHSKSYYSEGDYVYIYEDTLVLDLDESGNPKPLTQNNISLYGPTNGNGVMLLPSWSKNKRYKLDERIERNGGEYRCTSEGFAQTETQFSQVFTYVGTATPTPTYGGRHAFFVCEKNVSPGSPGHDPQRINILTSLHGDDEILIRPSDNLSKTFTQSDTVYIDFDYQNGNAFEESSKKIILSVFGNESGVDERQFLNAVQNNPDLTDAHPQTLSAWSMNTTGEGLASTGILEINVRVVNQTPTTVIERDFTPATPLNDSTSQTFVSSTPSMFYQNKFMIKDGKLYASGLDSSEFGFIGLINFDEFEDAVGDIDQEGSESRSYNKLWPFESIQNEAQRVPIYQNGSTSQEINDNNQVSMVQSEGGNTVFICGGKLYGVGHNQGYSLGLCGDPSDSHGVGQRANGLTNHEKKSESLQDLMEVFLHFDSNYYLELQCQRSGGLNKPHNYIGDNGVQFGPDQDENLMAWSYFMKRGFYQSINSEWEAIAYKATSGDIWGGATDGINYLKKDWVFTDQYQGKWISDHGAIEGTVQYLPHYTSTDFWQSGGVHAYNLDKSNASDAWGVMYIGDLDVYMEVSIFEKMKLGWENSIFEESFNNHLAQVKWKEDSGTIFHGTIDYTEGGVQPILGWNGILLSHAALNDRYPIDENMLGKQWWSHFKAGLPVPVAGDGGALPYKDWNLEVGATQAAPAENPTRSFYNNFYIYPSDTSTDNGAAPGWDNNTPGKELYIDGKPFWNPVLGNPDHILLDWASAEYAKNIDGRQHWIMGLYKLKSQKNITWGNYPRFSKFENFDSITTSLGYSEKPGGERYVDGLSGNNKQVIPARTYVPYATKLVDEDVTWAATNKYSTFYINNNGSVMALGSECACPAFKTQGFDVPMDPTLAAGGEFSVYGTIAIPDYDSFGSLELSSDAAFPIAANEDWGMIASIPGNVAEHQLTHFYPQFYENKDIFFGKDSSEYDFKDVLTNELVVRSRTANVSFGRAQDDNGLQAYWTEKYILYETSSDTKWFTWWDSIKNNDLLIRALYRIFFGREADTGGLNSWKTYNITAYEWARQALNSPEYQGSHRDGFFADYPNQSPIPEQTEKMMAIFYHYGNTAPRLTNGSHTIHLGRFKGGFIMEGCEREEVNGVYLPSLPFNNHLPESFGLADSKWFYHANNVNQQGGSPLAPEYYIYESTHNTELGKILVYWDANLKLWRMQYSDLWEQDTTGSEYRVQLLIGMQVHWADSNASDETGYSKSTKSSLKTPADVGEWWIGTGDWKNQNEDDPDITVVDAENNDRIDSTRVLWASPDNPVGNTQSPYYFAIYPPLINKTEGSVEPDLVGDVFDYYNSSFNDYGYNGNAYPFFYQISDNNNTTRPIRRFTEQGDGDIQADSFNPPRRWLPVHWTDRFMSVARDGGESATMPGSSEMYPNIKDASIDWNVWPGDVDFVNEFEKNMIARGNLAHNPGGAWKEALAFSSLDRKSDFPGVTHDGLDVWRFTLDQKSDVIFSAKITKSSGSFSEAGKVRYGLYVFKDLGYGMISTPYFWGMFSGNESTPFSDNLGITYRDLNGNQTLDYRHPGGGDAVATAYDPDLYSGNGIQRWFWSRFWRADNYYWPDIDSEYNINGRWNIHGDFKTNGLVDTWDSAIDVADDHDDLEHHFRNNTWRGRREGRVIYPGVRGGNLASHGTAWIQVNGTNFIGNELNLSVSLTDLEASEGFFVMLVAEHELDAEESDLELVNTGYEINTTVVNKSFVEPMFRSEVTTNLINYQNFITNEPEYAGEGHQFEHATGNFNENPLNYKYDDGPSGIYDWHLSLTDWGYYLDNQPTLEAALRADPLLAALSSDGVAYSHWNMPLTRDDRATRHAYIKAMYSKRLTGGATYFRGLESMRHNTNWFYDDLLGWTTKSVGSHSPENNNISDPYSSGTFSWIFSARYGNWFAINEENETERNEGRDFAVKFANHNFDFLEYISEEPEFNNKDFNFTRFSIIDGAPIAGYIPNLSSNSRYTQLDSYSYNRGDIVKIELAEGEKLYRTFYFMSLKDNNTSHAGFLSSLMQDEIKDLNIPTKKGLSKRYSVSTNTTSDETDIPSLLSGPIEIYNPDHYGGDKALRVSMGESHAIILTESGKVYGVGDNSQKQIDKYFERTDQFYNMNPDTNFGTQGINGYEYLERVGAGNSDPFDSMDGWKVINKPLFAVNQWNAEETYQTGDKVFIRKETFTALVSHNNEFNLLNKSDQYTNHPGVNPYFVNWEKMAERQEEKLRVELVCRNSVAEFFDTPWLNGYGHGGSQNSKIVFSGVIPDFFHHKSLKNHYRETRGDARFLTQECYLRPHRIKNFSREGSVIENVLIKNIKCSGYGSLFLDSANNLYGIGNNEISKSQRSTYSSDHKIGKVFGISSEFLNGPEFLQDQVTFMNKSGDFVSYISRGYAYKAGGDGLFPYFENYQNVGAQALILKDGAPIVAKMVFLDGPRFWSHKDWFLKRFLSQKINGKFYLQDEHYKKSNADRCALNTKAGQYLSNVFSLPEVDGFVDEWQPGKHYKEIIKEGEIMDLSDLEYVSSQEGESTGYASINKFECLSSCFESQMPSVVSYNGRIFKCIKSHGNKFGSHEDDFNIDNRTGRNWWTRTAESYIPGELGSENYWQEITGGYNRNMIQFICEKLNLFRLSNLSYLDEDNKFFIKGFTFGLSKTASGEITGIKDNSQLIAFERGAEIANRSPESKAIVRKYWNIDDGMLSNYQGVSSLQWLPNWKTYVDVQGEEIDGWTHPYPTNESMASTISGGDLLSFVDCMSFNKRKGEYWLFCDDADIDFSYLYDSTKYINHWESLKTSKNSLTESMKEDLNKIFKNNVHNISLNNQVAMIRLAEGWSTGMSSHYKGGRAFEKEGSFGEALSLIWPTVDPFALSIFSAYRGEYQDLYNYNNRTNSYSSSGVLTSSGLDLQVLDLSTNPRNLKASNYKTRLNYSAIFDVGFVGGGDLLEWGKTGGYVNNILAPEIMRVPSTGTFNWWDVVRDMCSRFAVSANLAKPEGLLNDSRSRFMENYYSQHAGDIPTGNRYPTPDASYKWFKPHNHICEVSKGAIWERLDDMKFTYNSDSYEYYVPWSWDDGTAIRSTNLFADSILTTPHWEVFSTTPFVDISSIRDLTTNALSATNFLNALENLTKDLQNPRYWFMNNGERGNTIYDGKNATLATGKSSDRDNNNYGANHTNLLQPKNGDDAFFLGQGYNQCTYTDLATHPGFFFNAYLLDPISLPFGNTILSGGPTDLSSTGNLPGVSINAGELILYKGIYFEAKKNLNTGNDSMFPFAEYPPLPWDSDRHAPNAPRYDGTLENSNWKVKKEGPMHLHRYRSQICIAHSINLSKIILNKKHTDDPYQRDAFIPQQTIGHSQIDFSFIKTKKIHRSSSWNLDDLHNFKNFNVMRRADWEQKDSSNLLPYERMKNQTHPVIENQGLNGDPLTLTSLDPGFARPGWWGVRASSINNLRSWYRQNVREVVVENPNWNFTAGIVIDLLLNKDYWYNVWLATKIAIAYGFKNIDDFNSVVVVEGVRHPDGGILNAPYILETHTWTEQGESVNWDPTQVSTGNDSKWEEYTDGETVDQWESALSGSWQTYELNTEGPGIIGGLKNTEDDASNTTESYLENPTQDYSLNSREIAVEVGIGPYNNISAAVQAAQRNEQNWDLRYKFPSPAWPALYGSITDYMEAISELHKYGFSEFTNGENSTHTIWGRELHHDFYCSGKTNSRFYSTDSLNYLSSKTPAFKNNIFHKPNYSESYISPSDGGSVKTFANNYNEFTAAYNDDKYYWEYTRDANNIIQSGGYPDDQENTIYIPNRALLFENAAQAKDTERNRAPEIIIKANGIIKKKEIHLIHDPTRIRRNASSVDGHRFIQGNVYHWGEWAYLCRESFTMDAQDLKDEDGPAFESNGKFLKFAEIEPISPSAQSEKTWNFEGNTENKNGASSLPVHFFEDFPATVKNLRHLRFELKPIYAMGENFHGENQVYLDALNKHDGAPDGTEHIHQGFINHNFMEGTRQWTLEGGVAGLVLSDYFDIFKEGYSYKGNRAYDEFSDRGKHSTTCLSQIMSLGIGDPYDYAVTREEAKQIAEEYVINIAKEREGLDYVWYDVRLESWVVGRNWLHEKKNDTLYPTESKAREAAHNLGMSDSDLVSWEKEYIPRVYKNSDNTLNKSFDKLLETDVLYIGGKEHHQCLARINGVIKKWEEEIESACPGTLTIENGQLCFGLIGTMLNIKDWVEITGISFDIS